MYTRQLERRYSDDGVERWLMDAGWRAQQMADLQRLADERGAEVVALSPTNYELHIAKPRGRK